MNTQQISGYLRQFRQNLQYKIAKAIFLRCMIFFTLYALLKILLTASIIEDRTKSELSYLKRIGSSFYERQKIEFYIILNFLDSSRKLVESGYQFSGISENCEDAYFDCLQSSVSNYTSFNTLYQLVKLNTKSIVQLKHPTSLFVYDDFKNVGFFNHSTLGFNPQEINLTLVKTFIELHPTQDSSNPTYSNYILAEAFFKQTTYSIFFCEHLPTSKASTLCVLFTEAKLNPISDSIHNYFYEQDQFSVIATGIQNIQLSNWISVSSFNNSLSDIIIKCLNNQPGRLSKFMNPEAGISSICTENQILFGLLGSCLPYSYFQIIIQTAVQTQQHTYTTLQPSKSISYYFSSNLTYYTEMKSQLNLEINQIRHTGYAIILTMALGLLVISISIQAIENSLISSIVLIKNLCEHLKSKEEKEFNSVKEKPQLFTFITDYFNKFMWIYKLLKFKSKTKHKKLLLEGIELFSEDYTSVQEYILLELIAIQNILISKYLRVRELPIKKKGTTKTTFKLTLPESISKRHQEKSNRERRNANMRLLDPDDDEFMKNISVGFRVNRGVRFSNDIQTIEIDNGPILRKAKFSENQSPSCATIKNDLSEPDLSSMKNTDTFKSLKEDEESYTSLNEMTRSKKKESSLRSRGLQSIHFDLNNMRLDEQISEEDEESFKEVSEEEEMFQMGLTAITDETVLSYQRIISFYEDLIKLKTKDTEHITSQDTLSSMICQLYELTLEKYIKIAELLSFQNEHNLLRSNEEKQKISEFEDMIKLEHSYHPFIKHELLQKGEIVRLLIHEALGLPAPFKNLEYLAKSQEQDIRIPAKYLLATLAEKLTPHLDEVLFNSICSILEQEKTNSTLKRKILALLIRTLERYFSLFSEEITELKLVRQFYNIKNKKIYFLASLSNPKPFSKLLNKFYDLIHPFDMISVFNLDEEMPESADQQLSDAYLINVKSKPRRIISDRIKFLLDLQDFNEMFTFQDKVRESSQINEKTFSGSSKTISKKRVYEKEFHQILTSIEYDQTQFSKYIVVLLGEEHGNYTGEPQDSSSSGNRRPYQQKIHQQITKNIDRGYNHFIMAGQQLSVYPSRYGRLKKYLKLAPQLLEIDLSDRDQQQNFMQLQKYLM